MNNKRFSSLLVCSNETIVIFMIVVTSISVFGIGSNQIHIIMAQQSQQLSQVNQTSSSSVLKEAQSSLQGSFFNIDNVTFSHHMASVNGIQMHYVIGGHGAPVVLLHGFPQS